jgi:transcription antitermination factor NusG
MGEAYLNLDSGLGEVSSSAFHSRAWYAVQTAYRSEQKVCHALSAKGFETYLPVLREIHQWTDRRKTIHVPAFSGYLFVRHEPWRHTVLSAC